MGAGRSVVVSTVASCPRPGSLAALDGGDLFGREHEREVSDHYSQVMRVSSTSDATICASGWSGAVERMSLVSSRTARTM